MSGRGDESFDMKVVRLAMDAKALIANAKPLVDEFLRRNAGPSVWDNAAAEDKDGLETVRCERCKIRTAASTAIRVEVPGEDVKFFDERICVLRWVRDTV